MILASFPDNAPGWLLLALGLMLGLYELFAKCTQGWWPWLALAVSRPYPTVSQWVWGKETKHPSMGLFIAAGLAALGAHLVLQL